MPSTAQVGTDEGTQGRCQSAMRRRGDAQMRGSKKVQGRVMHKSNCPCTCGVAQLKQQRPQTHLCLRGVLGPAARL